MDYFWEDEVMKGRIVKIGGKYQVCSYKTGNPLAKKYDTRDAAWAARMLLRAEYYAKLNEEEE